LIYFLKGVASNQIETEETVLEYFFAPNKREKGILSPEMYRINVLDVLTDGIGSK